MYNPLLEDPSQLKDQDLEKRILDLGRKYHMASKLNYGPACDQIVVALEMYKEEQRKRQREIARNLLEKQNKDFDDLIQVK